MTVCREEDGRSCRVRIGQLVGPHMAAVCWQGGFISILPSKKMTQEMKENDICAHSEDALSPCEVRGPGTG